MVRKDEFGGGKVIPYEQSRSVMNVVFLEGVEVFEV